MPQEPQIKFRPLTEDDQALIKQWKENDEDHRDYDDGYFKAPNTSSFMFYDEDGPVFAARLAPILRIGIQFNRTRSERKGRLRTARVLKLFLAWIEDQAKRQRFVELIYSSVSPDLIRFCERFGWFHSDDEYRKRLANDATNSSTKTVLTEAK